MTRRKKPNVYLAPLKVVLSQDFVDLQEFLLLFLKVLDFHSSRGPIFCVGTLDQKSRLPGLGFRYVVYCRSVSSFPVSGRTTVHGQGRIPWRRGMGLRLLRLSRFRL